MMEAILLDSFRFSEFQVQGGGSGLWKLKLSVEGLLVGSGGQLLQLTQLTLQEKERGSHFGCGFSRWGGRKLRP